MERILFRKYFTSQFILIKHFVAICRRDLCKYSANIRSFSRCDVIQHQLNCIIPDSSAHQNFTIKIKRVNKTLHLVTFSSRISSRTTFLPIKNQFMIEEQGNMETSSSYKLIYFDLRTLGEPIRMLFQYMKIPFKDSRINAKSWVKVKENFKWHQLPELHVTSPEGKTFMITQARAISRYLVNSHSHFNLMPTNPLEIAKCDEIVDALDDMRQRMKTYLIAKIFAKKSQEELLPLKNQLYEEMDFKLFLTNLEELLEQGEGDFILGNGTPTWADFWLANFTQIWEEVLEEDILGDRLKRQQKAVFNLMEIAKWVQKRPVSIC